MIFANLDREEKMFILNKISTAKSEWKTFLISDENGSKTRSFRAAHTYICLSHIRCYPPSPILRPLALGFLFQEFVKSSYLLDSLCLVEHRSSLSTNLDRVLGFWMDQLSRKILFAGLAQEYYVSFVLQGRHRNQVGRRSSYRLIGKQWPWLWGKPHQSQFDQGIGKC